MNSINNLKTNSLIKYSVKKYEDNKNLYTFTPNIKKYQLEDDLYKNNTKLFNILYRAHSCLVVGSGNNESENNYYWLTGPCKFGGISDIDEDPENGQEVEDNKLNFNKTLIDTWYTNNELEVELTEKANGKFAIMRIIEIGIEKYLLFGSKNSHHLLNLEKIEDFDQTNLTEIVQNILQNILENLNYLISLKDIFNDGYSLAGELCDGQHFCPGDNKVYWFGFFKDGKVKKDSFKILKNNNILCVEQKIVEYNYEKLMYLARSSEGEGYVMRFRNKRSNETIFYKTKSSQYITKRFLRSILLSSGYRGLERLNKRFIDAKSYHMLDTESSIYLTKLLQQFTFWMIKKRYPSTILGPQPVKSVRGILPNGFYLYWSEFLKEENIILQELKFGNFDENEYLKETKLYEERCAYDMPKIVFLQGLQGSGKSTIADALVKKLKQKSVSAIYYEQDMFYSDTLSCQGAIYHEVKRKGGANIIIISRCNANTKQYGAYLKMLYTLPTQIIFITPQNINEVYLMISLAGVLKRSQKSDQLLVGRIEYSIDEVIDFTSKNYYDFEEHKNTNYIDIYNENHDLSPFLLEKSIDSIKNKKISDFVIEYQNNLNELRYSIDNITLQIENIIFSESVKLCVNESPTYVALAVSEEDKNNLMKYLPQNENKIYLHHCTQIYYDYGKKRSSEKIKTVLPGEIVKAKITQLVIRKNDKACAFRVKADIEFGEKQIPHITASIPSNLSPSICNGFLNNNINSGIIIQEIDYDILLKGYNQFP